MDDFLKNLSTFDWVVIYTLVALTCVVSSLRIVTRIQKIRLKRLELKQRRLEQELHTGAEVCPAIQRLAEVLPDLCPQCTQLLKWKVTDELDQLTKE